VYVLETQLLTWPCLPILIFIMASLLLYSISSLNETLICFNALLPAHNHHLAIMSMKRSAEETNGNGVQSKRRALDDEEARTNFRAGLFETVAHEESRKAYASSEPYVLLLGDCSEVLWLTSLLLL
jgi:hypothetical protein